MIVNLFGEERPAMKLYNKHGHDLLKRLDKTLSEEITWKKVSKGKG